MALADLIYYVALQRLTILVIQRKQMIKHLKKLQGLLHFLRSLINHQVVLDEGEGQLDLIYIYSNIYILLVGWNRDKTKTSSPGIAITVQAQRMKNETHLDYPETLIQPKINNFLPAKTTFENNVSKADVRRAQDNYTYSHHRKGKSEIKAHYFVGRS